MRLTLPRKQVKTHFIQSTSNETNNIKLKRSDVERKKFHQPLRNVVAQIYKKMNGCELQTPVQ